MRQIIKITIEEQHVEIACDSPSAAASAGRQMEDLAGQMMHEEGFLCLQNIAVDVMKQRAGWGIDLSISIKEEA